jgi:acetyl esterase/lipase
MGTAAVAALGVLVACGDSFTRAKYPLWPSADTVAYQSSTQHGAMDVLVPPADVDSSSGIAALVSSVGAPRPALLAIHGGEWCQGNKDDMRELAGFLCPLGYVLLSPNYRLSMTSEPSHPDDAVWPAQLDDARAAYDYAKANAAQWNVDPDRIGVIGYSAGANLALHLAFRYGVRVVVDISGPTNFTYIDNSKYFQQVAGVTGHAGPWTFEELQQLSPLFYARSDVSVFIIHGARDNQVRVTDSDELASRLEALGADMNYLRVEGRYGQIHNDCWTDPTIADALARFLRSRL